LHFSMEANIHEIMTEIKLGTKTKTYSVL